MALGTSDADEQRTRDRVLAESAGELGTEFSLALIRLMEETTKRTSTTCQELSEPSEGIYIPPNLCGQTMRAEEETEWNQAGGRGGKGNEWWQVAEGNQILNYQLGQKTTFEAGRARTREGKSSTYTRVI